MPWSLYPSFRQSSKPYLGLQLALITFLFLGLASSTQASVLSPDGYPFPYRNPLIATILSEINRATMDYETVHINMHPERAGIAGLPSDPSVPMALFPQKGRAAPLVFVIAGSGGNARSGSALLIASQLAKLGFHAITLPDPLSQDYVLGVSETTLPGYLPRDTAEYYAFLEQVVGMLKTTHQLQITGFSVVGFSYGALLSGFLNREDQKKHVFNFSKTVMLNPAMDVQYGIQILDWYNSQGDSIYPQDKFSILGKIRELIAAIRGKLPETSGTGAVYTEAQVERLALDNTELQWVIGAKFRDALQDIIFTSQQIKDRGLLHKGTPQARSAEARKFSFFAYLTQFIAPSLGVQNQRVPLEKFWKAANFYTLGATLQKDRGAYVMESADDFLLHGNDIDFLKSTFGARLYLYPYGGHTGNFRFGQNQADFAAIMRTR
jgi:pimeloyl-ACP methyl ester carboxylesterase